MPEDKKIQDVDSRLEKIEKSNAEMSNSLTVLINENAELKEQLRRTSGLAANEAPEPPQIPTKGFKVDGKIYKFRAASFSYKGQSLSAKDAMMDETILADLVKRQSGLIEVQN